MAAAARTPLVGGCATMLFPFLVIFPGMIALHSSAPWTRRHNNPAKPRDRRMSTWSTPNAFVTTSSSGVLRRGLTALMASFMSGMAGKRNCLNTVWTYDIYQPTVRPQATDVALLCMDDDPRSGVSWVSPPPPILAARFNISWTPPAGFCFS